MKYTLNSRGFLRPAIFSACALAAFANPVPPSFLIGAPGSDETWLTRDEYRAPDGSLLRLFEDHYTDVSVSVERTVSIDPAHSDYVDLGAGQELPHAQD